MNDIIVDVLSSFLGIKKGDITDALKEGEDFKDDAAIKDYLNDQLTKKINKVRSDSKEEGKGWGMREALEIKEREIARKYGVDAKKIDELVEDIIKSKTDGKGVEKELTEEAIKNSDFFRSAIKAEKERAKQIEDEFNGFKTQVETRQKRSKVKQLLPSLLKENKFALPENETIQRNLLDSYVDRLFSNGVKFDISDDGVRLLDAETGKEKLDANHNPIDFNSYAIERAKGFFEIQQSQSQTPGGKPGGGSGQGGKNYSFPAYADKNEAMRALYETSDPGERKALAEHIKTL